MIIKSDNKDIEKEFEFQKNILLENGGFLHENLVVRCEQGMMSLEMDGPAQEWETVLHIPKSVLVLADGLDISIKNDEFVLETDSDILSPVQEELAHSMFRLYNLTNKLESHKQESPWLFYKGHEECLKDFIKKRVTYPKAEQQFLKFFYDEPDAESEEAFICDSFLKTRVLGYAFDQGKPLQVIMPILDCANHHYAGAFFHRGDKEGRKDGISFGNQECFVNSRENFAFYGLYDAVDTFLNYDYLDQDVPIVRSIEMEIEIEGHGVLKIGTAMTRPIEKQIPKGLQDLKHFMPVVNKDEDNNVFVSSFLIPVRERPHAMRRILFFILQGMIGRKNGKIPEKIIGLIQKAEEDIINKNIQFYKDTIDHITAMDVVDDYKDPILLLAKTQLCKLYKYTYNKKFLETKLQSHNAQTSPVIASISLPQDRGAFGYPVVSPVSGKNVMDR